MTNLQLKAKRFYLPELLHFSALLPTFGHECSPPLELQLCHIVSAILVAYKRGEVQRGFFVPLYAKNLKRKLGDGYKDALRILVAMDVIRENPRFSVGKFPKSYALSKVYLNMGVREVSFETALDRIRPDSTELTDSVLKFIHHNIGLIGLDELAIETTGIRTQLPLERAELFELAIARLQARRFDVRRGKEVDRTYSLVVECPREFREFITYKGKKLVEGDIRAAFPTLLLSLYDFTISEEAKEAEAYKAALDSDIYSIANMPRDKAKDAFQTFCSGNHRKTNRLAIAYRNRFPLLYGKVCSVQGNVLSCFLQDLESEIMNYTVVARCAALDLFIVPIHDGFMSTKEGAVTISHFLREEFRRRFDYLPTIKTVDYNDAGLSLPDLKASGIEVVDREFQSPSQNKQLAVVNAPNLCLDLG